MRINANQVLSHVASLIQRIIGFGLLILLGSAVLQVFGLRIPYIPTIDATHLVYLCGAWWLYSK